MEELALLRCCCASWMSCTAPLKLFNAVGGRLRGGTATTTLGSDGQAFFLCEWVLAQAQVKQANDRFCVHS